jgi:hypothetical protein
MTDWMTETDMLELDTPSREPSAEYAPVFGSRDEQTIHEDQRWMAYVARLAPDDRRAVFLLPDELPDAQSGPQQIRSAIKVAIRRAFSSPQFRIEDYELGKIQGEMRVLLPQGIELRYHFNNELGWKATVVINSGGEERSFPAYYRRACMNPVRRAAIGGEVDTSEVLFAPLDREEIQRIAANPELDRMTAQALRRLYRQYKMLSGQDR